MIKNKDFMWIIIMPHRTLVHYSLYPGLKGVIDVASRLRRGVRD
jgi:hypothetical protein